MIAERNWHKWLTLWVVVSLTTACTSRPIIVKQERISKNDTSVPKDYRELIGKDESYIQSKLNITFPDTINTSMIINPNADVFEPYPLENGLLVSETDFIGCIIDHDRIEYLQVHIEQQTKIQNAFISGTLKIEELCKESINRLNKNTLELGEIANEERNKSDTWKNVSLVLGIFVAGYLTNSLLVDGK